MKPILAAVITVSDKGYTGEREDTSGPLLAGLLRKMGAEIVSQTIVPDERAEIERVLVELSDEAHADLVVTTGGTGPAPRFGRGAAFRGVPQDAIGGHLAGSGGYPRADIDRQPARQPQGGARGDGDAGSHPAPRDQDAPGSGHWTRGSVGDLCPTGDEPCLTNVAPC
jgi:hypothetical protein